MISEQGDALSLLEQFQSFYSTLLSVKEEALKTWPVLPTSPLSPTPNQQKAEDQSNNSSVTLTEDQKNSVPPFPTKEQGLQSPELTAEKASFDASIAQISQKIAAFLKEQENSILQEFGQYAGEYYLEAQYIMAAYADELFLNLDWQGQKAWDQSLVEMVLFNSHVAGDLFFERLDVYLNTTASKSTIGLGTVYYYILSLGFQGKYRGQKNAEKTIQNYKDRLFFIISGHRPLLNKKSYHLYLQAYQQTVTSSEQHTIRSPKWWWGALFVLICCFVIVSHLTWINATKGAQEAMQSILKLGLISTGS